MTLWSTPNIHIDPETGAKTIARWAHGYVGLEEFMAADENLINKAHKIIEGKLQEGSAVVHPNHYSRFVIEPVTFCAANNLSFNVSNIVKYVCRSEFKNGMEDLLKAKRYIDMEIESMKRWERIADGENPQDVWKESL